MERINDELELHEDRIKNFNSVGYTDGSKTKDVVGLGFYIPVHSSSVNLGKNMTVYNAEVLGIIKLGEYLVDEETSDKNILICTDSEATVKSLRKDILKSSLVQNCCKILNKLATNNKVTIKRVPAHKGIAGNEEAGKLAKKGASSQFIEPEPYTGISIGVIKAVKKKWINNHCIDY